MGWATKPHLQCVIGRLANLFYTQIPIPIAKEGVVGDRLVVQSEHYLCPEDPFVSELS